MRLNGQPYRAPASVPARRSSAHFNLTRADVSLERRQIRRKKTAGKKMPPLPRNRVAYEAYLALEARTGGKGLVLLNTKGDRLREARDWFEPAIELAKIEDSTWHCNRHSFASRLVMENVDIRTVAQLMGHRTIQMTMRYAHLAPEHGLGAVERLVSPLEEVVTQLTTSSSRARGEMLIVVQMS